MAIFDRGAESLNGEVNHRQNRVLDSVYYATGETVMIAAGQAFGNIFDMAFSSSQMNGLVDNLLGANKLDSKTNN